MIDKVKIYYSDLVDALYYFEYHGPMYKKIKWIERDVRVRDLFKLIREIKFPRFKLFLSLVRDVAVKQEITSPKKLARYMEKNPPRGKFAEKWVEEADKMADILQEIYNTFTKKILTPEKKEELEKLREKIDKKYSKYWKKFKDETEKLPGMSWKRKEPLVCLLYPLDGRLSHKLKFGDIAYIETSKQMLDEEDHFMHEVVKLINNTKPIDAWVRQDRRGVRAIAYELFTQMQTLHILHKMLNKKPDFREVVLDKLETIWIPYIRPGTDFDEEELERILENAYEQITKHEFDALFQLGELYTEMNIVLLE